MLFVQVYFDGSTHKIAARNIDGVRTQYSEGRLDDITYRLEQNTSDTAFFVNSATGAIFGQFAKAGNFTMQLMAVDKGGQSALLERYTFAVLPSPKFIVRVQENTPRDVPHGYTDYDSQKDVDGAAATVRDSPFACHAWRATRV